MSVTRSERLRAEISMLEEMLARIAPGRVIERTGLQSRVKRLLAEVAALPPKGKRLDLTFRGEPVEGSRSIIAEFAGKAVAAFSEAVATIAASLEVDLSATGRLPGGGDRSLRIVGPALGSFGFELEVPPPPPHPLSLGLGEGDGLAGEGENPMLLAVERTMTLIEAAQRADEEELSDLIADVHPRAAGKVREFVKFVVDRRATFSLRMDTRKIGLPEGETGRRVLEALSTDDVQIEDRTVEGRLWVLPVGRQFELRTVEDVVLKGRIERRIADPSSLPNGGAIVLAVLRETRVRANRPRYTLASAKPRDTEQESD